MVNLHQLEAAVRVALGPETGDLVSAPARRLLLLVPAAIEAGRGHEQNVHVRPPESTRGNLLCWYRYLAKELSVRRYLDDATPSEHGYPQAAVGVNGHAVGETVNLLLTKIEQI